MNDNQPHHDQPVIMPREEYLARLIADHVAVGFPEDEATRVSEVALALADEVQAAITEIGGRHLLPLEGEGIHPAVPAAALHAAARLMSARMDNIHHQAGLQLQQIITPPQTDETQH